MDGADSKLVARRPWSAGLVGLECAGDEVIDEFATVEGLLQPLRSSGIGVVPEREDRFAEFGA